MIDKLTILRTCTERSDCGWPEFVMLISELVKFGIYISVVCATLTFAWAGFKMMVSGDNAGERSAAKSMMLNSVLGIICVLVAWLVVQFILVNLGLRTDGYNLLVY